MSGHTYKSAAVPFVNQKGERSMKKVKVERYVAGKEPSYAKKNDDDDEEYYTTDDDEQLSASSSDRSGKDEDYSSDEEERKHKPSSSKDYMTDNKIDFDSNVEVKKSESPPGSPHIKSEPEDDSDDDDPRLRNLKKLASKPTITNIADLHNFNKAIKNSHSNVVIDDDDDEEDVRQRHKLVASIDIKQASNVQEIFGQDLDNDEHQIDSLSRDRQKSTKDDTEKLLESIQLYGFEPKHKKEEEAKREKQLKNMLEEAKEEAMFTAQIHKKIQEDNKRDLEMEALRKDDLSSYDLESAKTDDEDDELAYNEWKLRELKRILRDRTARLVEAKTKSQKA